MRALREGWRAWRRSRGLALFAATVLAIGVGAALVAFAVLDTVLLRPLPIAAPDRVVQVWESHPRHGDGNVEVAYGNFHAWSARSASFTALALFTSVNIDVSLSAQEGAENGVAQFVTHGFFRVLGASPRLGRDFAAADAASDSGQAAIISHGLWQRRFGGDPGALGRTLQVDGEAVTVVGILPADFDYPRGVDLWVVLKPTPQMIADHRFRVWRALGRLRDGITVDAARRDMNAVAAALAGERPELAGFGVRLVPLLDEVFGTARTALPLLQGAALLVALIACVNVAHLLLIRAVGRRRELALRRAVGASERDLVRQLIGEGTLVGVCAAAFASGIAVVVLAWLRAEGPADLPRLGDAQLSGRSLLFGAALALATGAFAGWLAAFRAQREAAGGTLANAGARGSEGREGLRLRRALVISELALALVLLVGALLLLRSVDALERVDPGFRSERLFSARVALVRGRYPDGPAQSAFFDRLLAHARELPGVEGAAAVLLSPLSGAVGWDYPFGVEGQGDADADANPYANFQAISPGYFAILGIALLQGRDFDAGDRADAPPVVVVNESFAARYWPGADPIGKRLRIGRPGSDSPWATVVGVVRDAHYRQWGKTRLDLYAPFTQRPEYRMDVVLRSGRDVAGLAADFRAAVARLDPGQAVAAVTSMDALVDEALARPRFTSRLLGACAALAAVLAAIGVLGVLLHAVQQRRIEIGVRRALGATPHAVVGLVLRDAFGDALRALAIGIALALPAVFLLESLLYGVAPLDPWALTGAGVALLALSLLAAAVPALQAVRVTPMQALRHD